MTKILQQARDREIQQATVLMVTGAVVAATSCCRPDWQFRVLGNAVVLDYSEWVL
jgi:hypothetical protein